LILTHTVAVLSTSYAVFLGFCDDVFDLRWRHKLWLPAVATIPLLVAY
jgi:UDP-N-acetylglucosamine--dolichyl-phosphate N-acetylglucosaminephosphotransferase